MFRKSSGEEEDIEMQSVLLLKQTLQGVQGIQTFAFCLLTVNDEHTKQT